jgi:hypothetical protein
MNGSTLHGANNPGCRHPRPLFRLPDFQRERVRRDKNDTDLFEKKIKEMTELKPHS